MSRAIIAAIAVLAVPAAATEGSWKAECDRERRTVRIEMPAGERAMSVVHLEGEERPLEVRERRAGAIVAVLPRVLADGAYRIVLREAPPSGRTAEVPLVVGIVGPSIVE